MHDRSPVRRRQRTATREQWRLAKQRQRQREEDGIKRVSIFYSAVVIEALIAQSEDAGHSEQEAGKQSRNRRKVAADLADIIEQWARRYLAERT
jgi:hypothetical protein